MEEEGENEYILTGYPKPILYECANLDNEAKLILEARRR